MEFKIMMQEKELQSKKERSEIDAQKFRLASDVDANGRADLLEGKILELAQRAKEHEDKMEIEREKVSKISVRPTNQ